MKNRIKMIIKIFLSTYLMVGLSSLMLAGKVQKEIKVTVAIDKALIHKIRIYAIGFSVNGKGRGSLGRRTTKQGPANAKYSFGFRTFRHDVDCGKAILKQDSIVILYFHGKKCKHHIILHKKKS